MKKIIMLILTLCLLIFIVVLICLFPHKYETEYFKKIGIKEPWFYENIINSLGLPLREEIIDNRTHCVYWDKILIFNKNKNIGILQGVIITKDNLKFGVKKIGVGSTKQEVEKAYKGIDKIKDLPNRQIGFIDGDIWVIFEFNNKNEVCNITLTYGL